MFVMRRCQLSWEDALHLVQNRRYCISPNGGFLTQIKVSFVSASLVSFAFLCLELLSCTTTKHAVRELYVLMLCPRNTSRYTRHPSLLPGFRKGRCKELSPGGREMMMTMRRKSGASISGNYPLFFVSIKINNPSGRKTVKEHWSTEKGTTQWQRIYDRAYMELSSFPLVQFCLVYYYCILAFRSISCPVMMNGIRSVGVQYGQVVNWV